MGREGAWRALWAARGDLSIDSTFPGFRSFWGHPGRFQPVGRSRVRGVPEGCRMGECRRAGPGPWRQSGRGVPSRSTDFRTPTPSVGRGAMSPARPSAGVRPAWRGRGGEGRRAGARAGGRSGPRGEGPRSRAGGIRSDRPGSRAARRCRAGAVGWHPGPRPASRPSLERRRRRARPGAHRRAEGRCRYVSMGDR